MTHARPSIVCRLALMLVAVVLVPAVRASGQPIAYEALTLTTPSGTARGFFAAVQLQDPTLDVVVTAAAPSGSSTDSVLLRTDTWAQQNGVRLAINANFFSVVSGSNADIVGLSASNGVVVSPPRQFNGAWDPAITFDNARRARIGNPGLNDLAKVIDAVAGVGPSTTDNVPGTLLVTDGQNTGATARVDPLNRNPRTAIGVTRDGTTLLIVVIDGRQPSWSVGMTLPEVANLLISRGAWRAINLDGGGSSSFVWVNDNGSLVQNRPSDGAHRAVANHLGFALRTPTPNLVDRPIRGVWLRPPSNIATLESTVASLANAGIQDLFLETLYWGQDTGQSGIFPHRFSFDYLQQAITTAARYGVRVHAWCETGYLDFGTAPSTLLQQNPGWVVKHVDPANATTGDIANQRFVNLGNPGVRNILSSYFNAMTARYPGLEGVQADYHFFPLAPSGAAPFSYDAWARSAFQAAFGVDPISSANTSGSSFHPQWLAWNRQNVADALRIVRDATVSGGAATPGTVSGLGLPTFSAVAFSAWNSSTHTSKMIDLPRWSNVDGASLYFMMAYFASSTSISNDLQAGRQAVIGRRVVAGLANLTNSSRPSISSQLTTARSRGLDDFAWFDAPTFIANPTMLTELRNWLNTSAIQRRGDINADGYIDARDITAFDAVFSGTPVPAATSPRCDLDGSGIINARDREWLIDDWRRDRFGSDGVVDGRDLAFLVQCFTPSPANPNTAILHRWDLDGDRDVDYADQLILHANLTVPVPPDTDINRDGRFDTEDLYRQSVSPLDVNRNGVIDAADAVALALALRADEAARKRGGQR